MSAHTAAGAASSAWPVQWGNSAIQSKTERRWYLSESGRTRRAGSLAEQRFLAEEIVQRGDHIVDFVGVGPGRVPHQVAAGKR